MRAPVALRRPAPRAAAVGVLLFAPALLAAGCTSTTAATRPGTIRAVGAESQYANVVSQIGGRFVSVNAIERNPNTDPHSFEASPQVAAEVQDAQLVVNNGLGYDTYMEKIEQATPTKKRKVIDVQSLLGLPDSTPNPHLWYGPATMPAVAKAVARDLCAIAAAHCSTFKANLARFDRSLRPWRAEIDKVKATYPDAAVATTEPVGNDLLQAIGADIKTPWALSADLMNGVDPAPQDVSVESGLLSSHAVSVLVYNEQVVDSLTESWLLLARREHVPVVGVYETMPTGFTYQSWMLAETTAIWRALTTKTSTGKL